MKRIMGCLGVLVFITSLASAETIIYTRKTSFPKFGVAKTVYSVERYASYPNSKTVVENRYLVPPNYQIGFRQEDRYRTEPWDKYRMIMWR
jgi:hypothetical protein